MSSVRKGKLSLKKASEQKTPKDGPKPVNTILSMFQKQTDRTRKCEKPMYVADSGSEGDVIITKVITSNSGTLLTANVTGVGETNVGNVKEKKLVNETIKGGRNLSLSKALKKEANTTDFKKSKGSKPYQSTGKAITKEKNIPIKKMIEESSPSRYKFRRRKTVPFVDSSDSEISCESETIDNDTDIAGVVENKDESRSRENKVDLDKIQNCSNTCSDKTSDSDDDSSVMIVEDKKNRGKRKLSLKKSKTDTDVSKAKLRRTVVEITETETNQSSEPKLSISMKSTNIKVETKMAPDSIHKSELRMLKNRDDKNSVETVSKQGKLEFKTECIATRSQNENINDLDNVEVKDETNKDTADVEIETMNILIDVQDDPTAGSSRTSDGSHAPVDVVKLKREPTDHCSEAGTTCSSETLADDNDEEMGESTEVETFRIPYYLENFRTVMDSVLRDEKNATLFDSEDMAYFATFNQFSEPCQKLYIRIFSRKLSWLPMSKLKYPEISDDIPQLVDQLVAAGLLHSGENLTDLSLVLQSLPGPETKLLAKSFHINSTGLTKQKLVQQLMKKSQQSSISNMFKGGANISTEKTMLNRAKSYLGKVCRLQEEVRAVFIRVLMLFNLYNTNFDEDNGVGGQNQLFQMLMANIGRVVYPSYTVNRQRCIFADREALVRFETALQMEIDIQNKIEKSKWSEAYDIYKQAKDVGKVIRRDKQLLKWDSDLPEFLRLYTAGSVYVRIDNLGVEILQRLKKYAAAVKLLEELLAHRIYCIHYRGHWYERLALNLDAHLKSPEKSLDVVLQGLSDETVRSGRRLAIYERARKICEAPKSKYADRMADFHHEPLLPTTEVCIDGMVISDATSMGMKYQFVMKGDADSTTLCAVEELVLEHYKVNGYPEGLHAEGSVVSNLFVLLFWDLMYMDVVDVFHGPYQTCPLDLYTHDFYISRKLPIDERLAWLRQASVEVGTGMCFNWSGHRCCLSDGSVYKGICSNSAVLQDLCTEIGAVWDKHGGQMCVGISWEKFPGPGTHQGLASCMGGEVIADILSRYVKDPRHTRSGFPDLTLWNTQTKKFKICEVKGPNDKLSYKQILWIDYLLKHGVDAEACYVKAVGSKKLKPTSSTKS